MANNWKSRTNSIEANWFIIAIIVVFSVIAYFAWPRQSLVEIVGSEWTRYYQIQVLKTVKKYNRDWVPSGARVFNTDDEYVCHGTGKDKICSWEEEYDYEIEEYANNRVVAANGLHGSSEPRWPDYKLSPATGPYGTGQERVGESVQRYTLSFHSKDGDNYQTNLSMAEWNLYNIHQTVYITTSFSMVTKIRSLEN